MTLQGTRQDNRRGIMLEEGVTFSAVYRLEVAADIILVDRLSNIMELE